MRGNNVLTQRLSAGIIDASFASLATFAVGLAAVNYLSAANRGVYAVFFTAFMLGTVLPRTLIFTPAEVAAVSLPIVARSPLIVSTVRIALGPAGLGATSVLLAVAVTYAFAPTEVVLALALTTAVATFLSPLQDHVRKMLHIAERSWQAATISTVQFAVAIAAIAAMRVADIGPEWIPFGALSIANLISLTMGWAIARTPRHESPPSPFRSSLLIRQGRWLLLQAAAPATTGFAAAAIISRLAGPEALGFAEAARVVAQPILVLAAGLTAVLNPRVIDAAVRRDLPKALHTRRIYLLTIGAAGIAYASITAVGSNLNPMVTIVPSAYEVQGLVLLTVAANVAVAGLFLQVNELLGARREALLARLSWATAPLLVVAAVTSSATHAYARPLGRLTEAVARFVLQRRSVAHIYADPDG